MGAAFWFSLFAAVPAAGLDSPVGLALAGPPAALVAGWLSVRRRSRVPERDAFVDGAAGLAGVVAGLSVVLLQPGTGGWQFWAQRYDLVGLDLFAVGLACWLFGMAAVLRAWPALAVLVLSAPPVLGWLSSQLAPALAVLVSAAAWPAVHALAPAYRPGADLTVFRHLAPGDLFRITIADACAGLASWVTVLIVGIPAALYLGLGGASTLRLLGMGLAGATLANLVRVVIVLVTADRAGPAFALGVVHPWLGVVLLGAVLTAMVFIPRRRSRPAPPPLQPVAGGLAALVVLTALAGAGLQTRLLAFDALAGRGPAGPPVKAPADIAVAPSGWNVAMVQEIAWQDLFGGGSRSYLMRYGHGDPAPVTLQLVATPDAGRLYAYTPERCGIYHGSQVRSDRAVDLGAGQTGRLVDSWDAVPRAAGPGLRQLRFGVLYWYVPFTVRDRAWTARFALILDDDAAPDLGGSAGVDARLVALARAITARLVEAGAGTSP